MYECLVLPSTTSISSVTKAQAPDYIRQKLTKHEVTAGAAPKKLILQQP